MKILRNVGLISALGLSTALNAAVEFEDGLVPVELARLFIGGNVYRSLPDNFPVPVLPSGFDLEVIGSLDQGLYQHIVLRSGRDSEEVFGDLRAAYQAEGWVDLSLQATRLALCHDLLGMLQVQAAATSPDDAHIRVTRSAPPSSFQPGSLTCAQQRALIDEAGNENAPMARFFELMPVLELPESATVPPLVPALFNRLSSFSGSGNSFEMQSEGSFGIIDVTLAEVHQHFTLQLQEQGWTVDSNAVGDKSSSSVWYRTAQLSATGAGEQEDLPLTGVMTLLYNGDDEYRMLFRLQGGEWRPVPGLGIRGIVIGDGLPMPSLGIRGIP